jgi:hypothetical protein
MFFTVMVYFCGGLSPRSANSAAERRGLTPLYGETSKHGNEPHRMN